MAQNAAKSSQFRNCFAFSSMNIVWDYAREALLNINPPGQIYVKGLFFTFY